MITLQQPRSEDRDAALSLAKKWIELGCEHSDGELTFNDVAEGVLSKRFQLWALVEISPPRVRGVVITELQTRRNSKIAALICAGGETLGRKEVQPILEQWARDEGCSSLRIPRARKGWLKKLPDWGLMSVELVKEL